ncbi:MAG: DNA translocase FtsK 4TM domain-containing protein, partial [Candidatus Omnitrophota bacterium]|nr:DNA translocase FtsK 4TM domain-containing protein [Candidatus Omnitrophota bacterium]
MKQEHINEIKAVIVLSFAMILLASLISFVPEDLSWYTSNPNIPAKNLVRLTGAYLAGSFFFLMGYSAYFAVLFLFVWSWNKFTSKDIYFTAYKLIATIVLFGVVSSLASMIGPPELTMRFERGGILGLVFSNFLVQYFGYGSYIILLSLGLLALILTGEFLISPFLFKFLERFQGMKDAAAEKFQNHKPVKAAPAPVVKPKKAWAFFPQNKEAKANKEPVVLGPKRDIQVNIAGLTAVEAALQKEKQEKIVKPKVSPPASSPFNEKPTGEEVDPEQSPLGNYEIPSLNLLEAAPAIPASKLQHDLMAGAKVLEQTLANFGVEARVVDIERGPAITRYELEPAPGVKVQKFTTLSNDIALAMKAQTIRIVAPIPGKDRVGIEVPNDTSAAVHLKDVLSSQEFRSSKSKLTLSLGKDIAGKPMIADLAEMPHLLIAGTTGSGKTVCVNSIIMSMLFNATPDEVKFLMVDPKMVELNQYNDIPHSLCP